MNKYIFITLLIIITTTTTLGLPGRWDLLQLSIGVSAMHMQILYTDRVIIFDRTDFGQSNLTFPNGQCRHDPSEQVLTTDCTAHSVEYDPISNTFRPLMILTDTWCSSGTVASDGSLVQTGGFSDGERAVRVFKPCVDSTCDWAENQTALTVRRWYATNHILPDGSAIIIGGRRQYNYEFYPKTTDTVNIIPFRFLSETKDPDENNLYPFVHLNVDGNLFVFSNNRAVLLNYKTNKIVRTYPQIPGAEPRNYPSSGSSVLLPLKPPYTEAEVLLCGGAPIGSYALAKQNGTFVPALTSCGKIKITDNSPSWSMETMPTPRVMGDMILLPTGKDVLIINGAGSGTAGWELAQDPAYSPVIYQPDTLSTPRFTLQTPSKTPRLYHSSAILLRDGRVLVGGSNPHIYYNFSNVQYPTDLSLETFSPEYLNPSNMNSRPKIMTQSPLDLSYGNQFIIRFTIQQMESAGVSVTMVAPAFSTHSFEMNQRLLVLVTGKIITLSNGTYEMSIVAPPSAVLAPPGYYMVFVVNGGIPSEGIWAHIK
ncbi:hypothetical protein LUZ60_006139 [Juncus effusus]|nr:hypothetical protein LUZ60_006139 [Juncus effusus]